MTVCERINTILKERGMSRRKLAERAGIPPSSLQSALSRNTGLSLDMLLPISDVLGVSPEFLSGIEEIPSPTKEEAQAIYDNFELDEKIRMAIGGLNNLGLQKVLDRIDELLEVPKYQREI